MKKPISIYINLKISHIYFTSIKSSYIESMIQDIEKTLSKYKNKYVLHDIFIDCPHNIFISFHVVERIIFHIQKYFSQMQGDMLLQPLPILVILLKEMKLGG